MNKSHLIWIIVLVSFLLAVSGCGEKKEVPGKPAENVSAPAPTVQEPELPTTGVQQAGPDVTQPAQEPQTTPSEPVAEEEEAAAPAPAEVETVPLVENESSNKTDALTADNYRVISLKDLKAYPQEMKVKVGTTVEWRNVNDNLKHIIGWNGQKQSGVKPEAILQGESWSFTFDKPGKIVWFSTARPTTQGTIYVEE